MTSFSFFRSFLALIIISINAAFAQVDPCKEETQKVENVYELCVQFDVQSQSYIDCVKLYMEQKAKANEICNASTTVAPPPVVSSPIVIHPPAPVIVPVPASTVAPAPAPVAPAPIVAPPAPWQAPVAAPTVAAPVPKVIPANVAKESDSDGGTLKNVMSMGLIAGSAAALFYGLIQNNKVIDSVNDWNRDAALKAEDNRNASYVIGTALFVGGLGVVIFF